MSTCNSPPLSLELIGFVQGDQWRPGSPGVTVDTVRGLQITKALVI
jgi:hypothetical protein